ncbi:MAG: hypothetical protein K2N56_04230 [Oscillospiraceae bacterium]|nr:hypothetical protein [Oscillospiraceae bacterium]
MIDRIGAELNLSSVSNAANADPGEICLGFEKLLTEKTGSRQVVRHGYVGDGQDLCPEINEESIGIINALLSLTDDLEDIWKIVLRLEKKADIEILSENIVKDFDNVTGRNSAAALLTRFWKKKELLRDDVSEDSVDISTYFNQQYIKNNAASELEALTLKSKERKLITALNSD